MRISGQMQQERREKGREKQEEGQRDIEKRCGTGSQNMQSREGKGSRTTV